MQTQLMTTGLAVCLAAGLSLPVQAQMYNSGTTTYEPTGWYVGVRGGGSRHHLNDSDLEDTFADRGLLTSSSIDDNETAFALDVGYRLHPNIAIQGGYVDLGEFEFSSTVLAPPDTIRGKFKVDGFYLEAVGIWPFETGLQVYGKVGMLEADTELTIDSRSTGLADVSDSDDSGTNLSFGVAVGYDFTERLEGRLSVDRYVNVGDPGVTGETDIDFYALGIAYYF